MDVIIKHGSTNISQYVISYEREANICTGIGTLEVVLSRTYSTAINPHDTIDIYENGDFKVTYYVSDVDRNAPEATIRLHCQDKSKYLVDYFIPDQYTIDYPSYTRYWIEKFFTEAKISYQFTTSSQGNLLSNYTSLGLQPAYDQIMMLCQLSGWYFYFDGNGKAIIGSLTTDISTAGEIGKNHILDIKKTTDDKMLRNRAVVWGSYDPLRHEYAYADVSKHTTWNYDHRDFRTMVVSNNNIPTKSSANDIANILIKEFAKVTIVKELTIDGARNYNLGDMLRVSSHVWSGRGLITTFGVSMSRGGLVTKVILDERCPRLFGFFDFGDFVYVATWGDGVWRKHIKFDPTWYNFSTGLTDLKISDMHINNGVFGSVGEQGEMYYALYELPWNEIPISELALQSSVEDTTTSGGMTTYSGLHARAVIIDKTTNFVKFGIDNYSGLNTGDYFLYNYPSGVTSSGVVSSGGGGHDRAWIMEYDVLNGDTIGTSYPISLSGNYSYLLIDIENDGLNDYVSVATSGGIIIPYSGVGYNFGYHITQPAAFTEDNHNKVSYSLSNDYSGVFDTLTSSFSSGTSRITSVFENESIGEREIVGLQTISGTNTLKRIQISEVGGTLISTSLTSPSISGTISFRLCVTKPSANTYKVYYGRFNTLTGNQVWNETIYYRTWDALANTISAETVLTTITIDGRTDFDALYTFNMSGNLIINNKINILKYRYYHDSNASSGIQNWGNYIYFDSYIIDLADDSITHGSASVLFNKGLRGSITDPRWETFFMSGNAGLSDSASVFQLGTNPAWATVIRERKHESIPLDTVTEATSWLIYTDDFITYNKIEIDSWSLDSGIDINDTPFGSGSVDAQAFQLTGDRFLWRWVHQNGATYLFNGVTFTKTSSAGVPFNWKGDNVTPMFGDYDNYYVAHNPSTNKWYWCNTVNYNPVFEITFGSNYTPYKLFRTSSSYDATYYWQCFNTDTNAYEILHYSLTGFKGISIKPIVFNFTQATGYICGNFFLDCADISGAINKWIYINNKEFPNSARIYQVLRKNEDATFTLIEQESYPIRIDISNNAPLLTVGSGAGSFHSQFIYDNELTTITPAGVENNVQVNDYRYALLQTDSATGEVTSSGFPASTQIIFVTNSGVFTGDAETYSGAFVPLTPTYPEGALGRVETTNFTYPGQYIFITSSGDFPTFYQRDADKLYFETYSGLPDSRATIIRCDDYL